MIKAFAPAKVNLALHVTGQRADGYHLLDSLVVFVDVGDRLTLQEDTGNRVLSVTGRFADGVPTGPENLIWKAVDLLERGRELGRERGRERGSDRSTNRGLTIHLEKNLPHGAGIGGGSSDAAAVLRVLSQHWNMDLPSPRAVLALGADVPVCLGGLPARMQGIGEKISHPPDLPTGMGLVLINPGLNVPTGGMFQALGRKDNAPMDALDWRPGDFASFAKWCKAQRNDLEAAAMARAPGIAAVVQALAQIKTCHLARMSGSGSCCFGLFETLDAAQRATGQLQADHPDWWISCNTVAVG